MANPVPTNSRIFRKLRTYADPYEVSSVAGKLRTRRVAWLLDTFPDFASMRVLDLGGTPESWDALPVRPARVVLLNDDVREVAAAPSDTRCVSVVGDACDPPPEVRGESFDLVYSNSVFEHVGGHYRREQFAKAVGELAPRHWIQTPNRYFPLEPHWLFPGGQFLPTTAKAWLVKHWPGRWYGPQEGWHDRMYWSLSVELLTRAEMRFYFPESRMLVERIAGLPKSLIAVKA